MPLRPEAIKTGKGVIMGKIFVIVGKSSTGKDTMYAKLINDKRLGLKPIIPCTTRPIRPGEKDGKEYFFRNQSQLEADRSSGRQIEERVYHTVYGDWYYYTMDNDIDLTTDSYLTIGTPAMCVSYMKRFGKDSIVPIYLFVDDYDMLLRAINREHQTGNGKYAETCRRYLADLKDFSEEKLDKAGINFRVKNDDFERAYADVALFIMRQIKSSAAKKN